MTSTHLRTALEISAQAAAQGDPLRLRVNGRSMAPLLRPGDWVIVAAGRPEDLARGDLVVIRSGDSLITHRLLRVRPGRLLTKGDNTWRADPPVEPGAVLGRVMAREREGVLSPLPPYPRLACLGLREVRFFRACARLSFRIWGPWGPRWLMLVARLLSLPFRAAVRLLLFML